MDFLDPQKRRAHQIRLFVGYGLMALLVVLITTFLVYFAYGYNVTRDGEVDQRGLVFVSSQPSGSRIFVDDRQVGTTGARLVVSSGERNLRISREGYHDWSRTITVRGSSVEHYTYPFLVPTELTTNTLKAIDQPLTLVTQSPDRRWVLTQVAGADTFELYDLNRNQTTLAETTVITLSEDLLSPGTTDSWRPIDWASNNRHALLLRAYTDAQNTQRTEYLLVDRQRPAGSHNLTRELALDAQVVLSLRDKKPDSYYLHDQETQDVYTAAITSPTLVPVVQDVLAFAPHDANRILYATPSTTEANMVDVLLKEGNATYVIRTIPESDTYLLNLARYDGSWFVALGAGSDGRTYLYKDPVDALKRDSDRRPAASVILAVDDAISVTFSSNTRFVAAQNGSQQVHVYDAEQSESYRFTLAHRLDAPQTIATWMDGHRLTYVSGGQQYIVDYDNTNERQLAAASSTFLPVFAPNYRYTYSFMAAEEADAEGDILQSTALRTPSDL